MVATYTGRRTEVRVVKEITESSVSYGSMGHGLFPEMKGVVRAGDTVVLETKNLSTITGMMVKDASGKPRWLFRKSDEDLDREHKEMVAKFDRERQEWLDEHRDELEARTAALPDWIRKRIERFRQSPSFEKDGWGYELCIAELAVLYAEHGFEEYKDRDTYEKNDQHPIWAYADKHGTSGNQHDFAKALARVYVEGKIEDAGGTVSGLTPITGDPFYEGTEPSERVQST